MTDAVAFFDVDGTLVWRDFEKMRHTESESVNTAREIEPTAGVKQALKRMRKRGNLTFICTGRPLPFVMPSLLALEPDGLIAAAGAYVRIGDTVVRDVCFPEDVLRETARRFFAAGIDTIFESNIQNVELRPSGAPARFPGSVVARSLDEFDSLSRDRKPLKICTNGVTLEDLAPVRAFLDEHFTISDLQGGVLELALRGVDKGTAIEAALSHLGHGRAHTFAFGDSENDLSMAGAVEVFVAMGNALPQVKAAAGYITDSAADDGVVTGLAHFGLI